MKLLLVAVNAKYIHSNPAVYDLKAYAGAHAPHIELAEYTINQLPEEIVKDIYVRQPDVIAFSCYIWNIRYVRELTGDLRQLLPQVPVWLGGPEVSFDSRELLTGMGQITGIMRGEGEAVFRQLAAHYVDGSPRLTDICGLTWREDGQIRETACAEPLDMSEIPFAYQNMDDFANRIVYYESSRGCPFSCSYCLSSVDKRLRFRSLALVKKELAFFLDAGVAQVKFVDRTFNCKKEHARVIWRYLLAHDNGVTNFHFEIAADLLDEEDLSLIRAMRPGQIQLEIGVQSTNPRTIREIRRTMDFEKVARVVREIKSFANTHQHLDLIAGLPYEDLASFRKSFNDVYALRPDELQLGFLKVLRGSYMYEMRERYGLKYRQEPPYEVLSTDWLPYGDVIRLKAVEEMVEVYYNSGQFPQTLAWAVGDDAYGFFEELAAHYERLGLDRVSHSRLARYEILYDFLCGKNPAGRERIGELLTYDLCLRERLRNRPSFARPYEEMKEEISEFFTRECECPRYLPEYAVVPYRKLIHMVGMEIFSADLQGRPGSWYVLFDYERRDPLSKNARTVWIRRDGENR